MKEPSQDELNRAMKSGLLLQKVLACVKTILAMIGGLTVFTAALVLYTAWEKKHDAEVLTKASAVAAEQAKTKAQQPSAPVGEQ